MAKQSNNHKYVCRENGKVIYLGSMGKTIFDMTKDAQAYRYIGEISQEEQDAEVEEVEKEKLAAKKKAEKETSSLSKSNETVKVTAKKLSREELDEITKGKKVTIGSSDPDEDDEDELDEKLAADKKELAKKGKK